MIDKEHGSEFMNYYERIQHSIIYIEANLDNELTLEACAQEAFMSVSNYYRMFLSIVGYNVKEYIRRRRLTLAYEDLYSDGASITEIAFRYMYNSTDSFTRAFKKEFGILPSQVKQSLSDVVINKFERIDIMDRYFETDQELLDKYPDIKVIKELDSMKVACFTYFGEGPEGKAYKVLLEWMHKNGIVINEGGYRLFGYNHPDTMDQEEKEYGYEMCVTIPDELYEKLEDVPENFTNGTYDGIKRRIIEGGKYAILSVKRDSNGEIGNNIAHAWKRFFKWLDEGKYIWGGRQYLEEHLGFDSEDDHIGGVELYLPIEDVPKVKESGMSEMTLSPFRVAVFREEGKDGEQIANACWWKAITWAKEQGLKSEACRIFQYNKGFDRRPPFFHVIMMTLPDGFNEERFEADDRVQFEDFLGGKFMTMETDLIHLGSTWMIMEQWRKETKAKAGGHQWVEEWLLEEWKMPAKSIRVCYPIA